MEWTVVYTKMLAIYSHVCSQYVKYIRECGSTLYVEMAQGVSLSLYIGIGAKFENMQKTGERRLRTAERPYYKLTLKASEHIPLRNNRASKIPVFVFFFFFFFASCNSRTKGAIGALLGRNY